MTETKASHPQFILVRVSPRRVGIGRLYSVASRGNGPMRPYYRMEATIYRYESDVEAELLRREESRD